jgi:hypothetical protein
VQGLALHAVIREAEWVELDVVLKSRRKKVAGARRSASELLPQLHRHGHQLMALRAVGYLEAVVAIAFNRAHASWDNAGRVIPRPTAWPEVYGA